MSAMIPRKEAEKEGEKSTNLGRFMTKRGILLMKEFRQIGIASGDYGDRIVVSTLIISQARSTKGNVQFGIRFEHYDDAGDLRDSGFLDYDEIAELMGALDFVDTLAGQMVTQKRDYTEINYLTKDNLKFGFFQSNDGQQAFVDISGYGRSLFLSLGELQDLKQTIGRAKEHLVSKGADHEIAAG
jgi:hypothetical protein